MKTNYIDIFIKNKCDEISTDYICPYAVTLI